ncbi:MAG TPA: polysaccharide biosynthesis/export family protein [Flavobacterium sp.]|jgi:polysaccharide export outer membrane protein|nr:polysaccharide biosynthesis/export family protein [Flavobacterium sp.]
MNKYSISLLILLSVFFTSCIPTKDLIYLQENNSKENSDAVTQLTDKPYRLQVNDLLNVSIKAMKPELVEIFNSTIGSAVNNEQAIYFNGYVVDDHGNIRLPVLGEINVLGHTFEEVRIKVEKKLLEEYFNKEAGIYVNVRLGGFRYTVNGEVSSSGTKVLYQDRVNIMEAIANSGDIEITGNRKDVVVIRRFPQGNQTYHIDLTDSNAVNSPAYQLQHNDYIYVKPLKQKTWGTGRTGIESLSTIITLLSLATTTYLLLNR